MSMKWPSLWGEMINIYMDTFIQFLLTVSGLPPALWHCFHTFKKDVVGSLPFNWAKTREKQKIKIIRSISWSWILNWKQYKLHFFRVLCITNQVRNCSKHVSNHCHVSSASFAKDLQESLSKPSKTLHSLLEAFLEYLSSIIWLQATVIQWLEKRKGTALSFHL